MPVTRALAVVGLLILAAGCARKEPEPLPGPPSQTQGGFGPQRIPPAARPPARK